MVTSFLQLAVNSRLQWTFFNLFSRSLFSFQFDYFFLLSMISINSTNWTWIFTFLTFLSYFHFHIMLTNWLFYYFFHCSLFFLRLNFQGFTFTRRNNLAKKFLPLKNSTKKFESGWSALSITSRSRKHCNSTETTFQKRLIFFHRVKGKIWKKIKYLPLSSREKNVNNKAKRECESHWDLFLWEQQLRRLKRRERHVGVGFIAKHFFNVLPHMFQCSRRRLNIATYHHEKNKNSDLRKNLRKIKFTMWILRLIQIHCLIREKLNFRVNSTLVEAQLNATN